MEKEYYDDFEEKLNNAIFDIAKSNGMIDEKLPLSDDFMLKWKDWAPAYFADAVKEIAQYPLTSIAWAGYIGLVVAYWWDKDWENYKNSDYKTLYGRKGFDDMDEHIAFDILKMNDKQYAEIENLLRNCSETALTLIRHENIEPQTPDAFYVYARTVKALYSLGVCVELNKLGYKAKKLY